MAKILLVEDDNNLREIYAARLTAEGYQIVSAPDGEEALAIAVKEKPDLIITDVMMPKISGFDMLDILRNAPETKDTKIIMMTALSQAEDKERADKLGADMYLVKSQVTLEDVAASVHKVLGESDKQQESETPAETPPADAPAEAPAAPASIPPSEPAPATPPESPASPPTAPEPPAPAPPAPEPATPTPEPPAPATPPAPVQEQAVAPASATEPATAPAPELPQPTTKKIEVVLPDAPDEQKPPEQKPAEASAPAPAPATPAVKAPDNLQAIGPTLTEALAEEEKSLEGQTMSDKDNPAASPSNPAPSSVVKPQPAEPAAESESPATRPENHNTKVIEPLNDPNKAPDLQALLAKEEGLSAAANPANDPGQAPPASPDHPDDLSKISL